MSGPLVLAIDTATHASMVGLGEDTPRAVSRRQVQHRHGSGLLAQIDEVLARCGRELGDVSAIAVGSGPGSFTGLRVGMATAKTIAYARGLRLLGLRTSDAIRRAAVDAGADPAAAVVLPAGARDHYVAAADAEVVLVPPGGLEQALGGRPAISIDLDEHVLGAAAVRIGAAALEGLPGAMLAMAQERLIAGHTDDPAGLVPAYVALPRGVIHEAEDLAWSPDLR